MNRKIMNVLILSVLCIALLPVTGHLRIECPERCIHTHEPILINGKGTCCFLQVRERD